MRASKHDELVQKALKTFYIHGFHATGMDKLAKETGISKTSMYKHYSTKEDLILATLKLRHEKFLQWFTGRMQAMATTPKGQLLAMFDALAEGFARPDFASCMFIKASAEFQDPKHPVHIEAAHHKHVLLNHITKLAKAAKINNPTMTARQLMLLVEGATTTAHLGHTKNPASDAKKAAEILLANAGKKA